MKKLAAFVLALMLALTPAFAENADTEVLEKLERLMFEESNVTLDVQADFMVDGEVFKVFRGEYKQDGVNSYMDVAIDTPLADTMLAGGFTVVANGINVYARDIYYGNYFESTSTVEEDTVLQKDNATNAAIMLAKGALDMTNAAGNTFFVKEDGKYVLNTENAPALMNQLAAYFISDYVQDEMYLYNGKEECMVFTDALDMIIAEEYKAVKGEEMPETFIEDAYMADVDDEMWLLYFELYETVMNRVNAEAMKHDGGILWLHDDGEMTWHKDYTDYLLAADNVIVDYEDYQEAFRSYYFAKCGEEYTDELDTVLAYTYNFDLWEAHVAMMMQMEEEYQLMAQETEGAVYMMVYSDGSVEISERVPQKYEVGTDTTTQKLLRRMRSIEIGKCDVVVTTDDEGRIAGAEGKVEAAFIREDGVRNIVSVVFTAEAKDYGKTVVAEFDPADYNSCMYEDYEGEDYFEGAEEDVEDNSYENVEEVVDISVLPAVIRYAGVEYDTMLTE